MSVVTTPLRSVPALDRVAAPLVRFGRGVAAVVTKELRGRMRGRRAFMIVTIYLVLLSVFAWAVYQLMYQANEWRFQAGGFQGGGAATISAEIGRGIFVGLLMLQTLLVLVLAPALTSGAISQEREKQTLDLLVATPLSRLALVVGKLFSALAYVLLLIVASIPLAAIVFTFGGVGPEDIVRAYMLLLAVAFGTGAAALFFSALLKRTQAATVVSYLGVLAVTLGATVLYIFLFAMSSTQITGINDGRGVDPGLARREPAPEAVLWLNPFVAGLDVVCGTTVNAYDPSCAVIYGLSGRIFDGSGAVGGAVAVEAPAVQACDVNGDCKDVGDGPAVLDVAPEALAPGPEKDSYWPRSALAFVGLGVLATLAASRLVAPAGLPRRRRR
jgi:ABC-type transport system involved in multi-copper enzyme maturation permease subunit